MAQGEAPVRAGSVADGRGPSKGFCGIQQPRRAGKLPSITVGLGICLDICSASPGLLEPKRWRARRDGGRMPPPHKDFATILISKSAYRGGHPVLVKPRTYWARRAESGQTSLVTFPAPGSGLAPPTNLIIPVQQNPGS
jgi:hypothetical protein